MTGLPAILLLAFLVSRTLLTTGPFTVASSVNTAESEPFFAPCQLYATFAQLAFCLQGWKARPSLRKLRRSQSQIMATYYAFLWIVAILGALRCAVQVAEVHAKHRTLCNSLWLLTRFGAS